MAVLEFEGFEWDEHNVGHLARHQVDALEAEQAILNRPLDLGSHIRNGEKRIAVIGETNAGKILAVVVTLRGRNVRVITAWKANREYRRYFLLMKRNANVGRIEE